MGVRQTPRLFVVASMLVALSIGAPAMGQELPIGERFTSVALDGHFDVTIEPAALSSVRVLSPADGATRMQMEVLNEVLYLIAPPGERLALLIEVDQLREVVANGNVIVRARHLRTKDLLLDSRGTSHFAFSALNVGELSLIAVGTSLFEVSGNARRQVIDLDGAGQVHAQNLVTQSSEVRVRGAGEVALQAVQHLNVDVAGSARVTYTGSPAVARQIHGVGIVQAVR